MGLAAPRDLNLIALDEALNDLAKLNLQHSRVVELRFFGGLTNEELAEILEISPRTVQREWRMARAWLRQQMMINDERDDAAG